MFDNTHTCTCTYVHTSTLTNLLDDEVTEPSSSSIGSNLLVPDGQVLLCTYAPERHHTGVSHLHMEDGWRETKMTDGTRTVFRHLATETSEADTSACSRTAITCIIPPNVVPTDSHPPIYHCTQMEIATFSDLLFWLYIFS